MAATTNGSRSAGSAASPDAEVVSLEFPSCARLINPVDVFVGEVAKAAGFDADAAQDVQVAVHEAVINAIVHGNGEESWRRVRLEVATRPEGLEARIEDQGPGFDLEAVPDPLDTDNLRKPCGRGIFFMRLLMDEVRFRHDAGGGTEVTLLKRRAPATRRTPPSSTATASFA